VTVTTRFSNSIFPYGWEGREGLDSEHRRGDTIAHRTIGWYEAVLPNSKYGRALRSTTPEAFLSQFAEGVGKSGIMPTSPKQA
jgi:hypothetical protein